MTCLMRKCVSVVDSSPRKRVSQQWLVAMVPWLVCVCRDGNGTIDMEEFKESAAWREGNLPYLNNRCVWREREREAQVSCLWLPC